MLLLRLVLAALLSWMLLATPVFAQTDSSSQSSAEFTAPLLQEASHLDASGISSEKINQFVQAYLQVVDFIERREGELQSAETETESRRIERDIEAGAFTLIEKAGLTRQEYLQLLGLANTDPEFGERIAAQLQESADF